mmetsp:Transcript_14152/g.46376  ORF Transcript_14152/g.46376 Transcript_14152/m.46376 type:complete len:265 (-) Transcript_14152:2497-3291(-)|eukprot:scaffold12462_cov109-Isochrysis_galbana.AAC.2
MSAERQRQLWGCRSEHHTNTHNFKAGSIRSGPWHHAQPPHAATPAPPATQNTRTATGGGIARGVGGRAARGGGTGLVLAALGPFWRRSVSGPGGRVGCGTPSVGPPPRLGAHDDHLRPVVLMRLELADDGRLLPLGPQDAEQLLHVRRRRHQHHADAAVEGAQQLGGVGLGAGRQPAEYRGGAPRGGVERAPDGGRQHARQVLGQPAAGDVREGLDVASLGGGQAALDVQLGGGEQGVGQRRGRGEGRRGVPRHPRALHDAPNQ